MRKIFTLLAVVMLSASSAWAERTLDYNMQFFKQHYFYHIGDEMNVVDVNVEWPKEVNHTAVPVLQRVLSGLSFGVETDRFDDALATYLKRFGEPVKGQFKTIPDDKKYCYAHVNVRVMGYIKDQLISFQISAACQPASLSSQKAVALDTMVNYDVVNDRMLAKEDILRMTWVNSSMYHQDLMQLLVNGAEVDLETANVPDSIDINQWPKAVAVGENLVFADLGFKLPDTDYDVLSTFTFGGLEEFLKNSFLKRLKRPATENTPQQLEEPQPLSEDLRIYSQVDSMPHYIGGDKELFKFISSNLVYPPLDLHLGISGKVVLSYIIEKDGTFSNIAVISPVSPRIDREAVRVLRLSHKWEPAMVAGKPVRMRSTIPVSFLIKAPRVATVITQ